MILYFAEFHEFKLQSLVRHSFDLAAQEKQSHELDEISTQVCPQFPTRLFSSVLISPLPFSSLLLLFIQFPYHLLSSPHLLFSSLPFFMLLFQSLLLLVVSYENVPVLCLPVHLHFILILTWSFRSISLSENAFPSQISPSLYLWTWC